MLDPVDNPLLLKVMFFISFALIIYALMPPRKKLFLSIGVGLLLFSALIYFAKYEMGKESFFRVGDGTGLFE